MDDDDDDDDDDVVRAAKCQSWWNKGSRDNFENKSFDAKRSILRVPS